MTNEYICKTLTTILNSDYIKQIYPNLGRVIVKPTSSDDSLCISLDSQVVDVSSDSAKDLIKVVSELNLKQPNRETNIFTETISRNGSKESHLNINISTIQAKKITTFPVSSVYLDLLIYEGAQKAEGTFSRLQRSGFLRL